MEIIKLDKAPGPSVPDIHYLEPPSAIEGVRPQQYPRSLSSSRRSRSEELREREYEYVTDGSAHPSQAPAPHQTEYVRLRSSSPVRGRAETWTASQLRRSSEDVRRSSEDVWRRSETSAIPHSAPSLNPDCYVGVGLVLERLSDGSVYVSQTIPGHPCHSQGLLQVVTPRVAAS